MAERLAITLPAVLFLTILFGGGARFRRRSIDMDGAAPINKPIFATSKYAILVLWLVTIAHAWGLRLMTVAGPGWLVTVAVGFWLVGFALLLTGRLGLGDSFRIGSAKEATRLRTGGLFGMSRNPMYVGVYATLLAATLYTRNPIVSLVAVFIVIVHHQIVLAEEGHLRGVFGQEYVDYCGRVRRYLERGGC